MLWALLVQNIFRISEAKFSSEEHFKKIPAENVRGIKNVTRLLKFSTQSFGANKFAIMRF
jgi:hypothetical protein